jgi:hypothetical protein
MKRKPQRIPRGNTPIGDHRSDTLGHKKATGLFPSPLLAPLTLSPSSPSSVILPSHLNRADKLIPLGSVLGGELCIRDDLEALQSVFVCPPTPLPPSADPVIQIASPCVIGLISQEVLCRINNIYPTTLDTLQANMTYVFLESVTQSVPLLWLNLPLRSLL